jgi:DNA-binding MarR family transcriptional regulator
LLSKKEMDILTLISNHSSVSNKALINLFDLRRSNLSKYLNRLKERGFVESIKDQRTTVWFLTQKSCGILEALKDTFFKPDLKDEYDPELLNHNTSLANLEWCLNYPKDQNTNVEDYIPDRYLKRRFAKNKTNILKQAQGFIRVPDAEFLYKSKYRIGIELELTKKAKYRYEKMFNFFRYYEYYDRIFWIFKDESLEAYVKKVFSGFYQKSKAHIKKNKGDKRLLERDLIVHNFLKYDDVLENKFKANMESLGAVLESD